MSEHLEEMKYAKYVGVVLVKATTIQVHLFGRSRRQQSPPSDELILGYWIYAKMPSNSRE